MTVLNSTLKSSFCGIYCPIDIQQLLKMLTFAQPASVPLVRTFPREEIVEFFPCPFIDTLMQNVFLQRPSDPKQPYRETWVLPPPV